ncbi:FAD-binding protein [bacterium]|nr:FAD-binding protein [bacterium]MBU1025295.1 FAD-binding protein [bacterium]
MNKEPVDLIVIGGGLSGLSCAITACGGNMNVLLIEGEEPDAKTRFIDELVYPHALKKILADYKNHEDLLFPITRRAFWIVASDSHTAWECVTPPDESGLSGYVANRPELDLILLERFRKIGGEYKSDVNAVDLFMDEEGDITGVKYEDEKGGHFAPVTVVANGPRSILANGLLKRENLQTDEKLLIVKEVLVGENGEPSRRLTGNKEHAASILILGDPLDVGFSWARLIAYGNKLAIKVYVPMDCINDNRKVETFVESLKMHPSIEPIVRGLKSEAFFNQTVPIGGFEEFPDTLWGEGFIVTGKAARLYHPYDCRMTDYSIVSGVIAGKAAINAKIDNRASCPCDYPRYLSESFLLSDRNSMSNVMNAMRKNSKFASEYPQIMLGITSGIFTMDSRKKCVKKSDIEKDIRSKSAIWDAVSDFDRLIKLYG